LENSNNSGKLQYSRSDNAFYKVFKNVPAKLLGTRFTNIISCFVHGPQAGLEIHCEKGTAKVALDLSNYWRAPRQFSGQYMGTTATVKNSKAIVIYEGV
jgi:hypothetical protein